MSGQHWLQLPRQRRIPTLIPDKIYAEWALVSCSRKNIPAVDCFMCFKKAQYTLEERKNLHDRASKK